MESQSFIEQLTTSSITRAEQKNSEMVALSQTWKSATQRPTSAQISRQTSHHYEHLSATPTRIVLRARYYDPHTAEFTSPDPLEYVDGMSLFRGYFELAEVDAFGTKTSRVSMWDYIWTIGNLFKPKIYSCRCKCLDVTQYGIFGMYEMDFQWNEYDTSILGLGFSMASSSCRRKCKSLEFEDKCGGRRNCSARLVGITSLCSLLDNYCLNLPIPFNQKINCLKESQVACACLNGAEKDVNKDGIHLFKFRGNVCEDCVRIFRKHKFSGDYFESIEQGALGGPSRPLDDLYITHRHVWDLLCGKCGGTVGIATIDFWNGCPKMPTESAECARDWWGTGTNGLGHVDPSCKIKPYEPYGWIW